MYRRFLTLPAMLSSIFLALAAWVASYQFEGVQRPVAAVVGFILGVVVLYRIQPKAFLGEPKYPAWVQRYLVNEPNARPSFLFKAKYYRLVRPVSPRKLRKARSDKRMLFFDVEEFKHDGSWGPVERHEFVPRGSLEAGGVLTVTDFVYSVRVDRTGMGVMEIVNKEE